MPFRNRLRKVFSRTADISSSLSSPKQPNSTKSKLDLVPSATTTSSSPSPPSCNRPFGGCYQEQLEAFTWQKAWRSSSNNPSIYSPMGSRVPSRQSSTVSSWSKPTVFQRFRAFWNFSLLTKYPRKFRSYAVEFRDVSMICVMSYVSAKAMGDF